MCDERTGQVHDYRHRRGVVEVRTQAPAGAPPWASDLARLWNTAEKAERVNGAVAREVEIALPAELDGPQRSALVADLVRRLVDRYGVAATAAVHAPGTGGDSRNHHVHVLMTTRILTADGLGAKTRILDDRKTGRTEVAALRGEIARLINEHLARAGLGERVDHRTLRAQARSAEATGDLARAIRLTRVPTIHAGKTATALVRRGASADRLTRIGAIVEQNRTGLTDYLARVQGEGWFVATPIRSGLVQARMDRQRESTAIVARAPVGSAPIKLGMARGIGSEVLNEQSRVAEQTLRVQADALRDYLSGLDDALRQILEAYAQLHRLEVDDVRALVRHCRRDARCAGLLKQTKEARTIWERAQTRSLRRRDAHGTRMAETAREQSAWRQVEAETQPKAWQRAARRMWAERRRRQRERLRQAQEREHQAAKAVGNDAMAAYANAEKAARQAWHHLEQQRRERYPLPSDPRPAPVDGAIDQSPSRSPPAAVLKPTRLPGRPRLR